ncbi:MAG: sugar phosphate isomerase/epimerase family protein [Promethearchaeota archaeon]
MMIIKYAISNWIYGEEPWDTTFKRLEKFGYDGIELMVESPDKFDIKQAKKLIKEHDLPCTSICTMMTGAASKEKRRNLVDKDPDVRKQTIQYLTRCLDIGNELDANLVLTVPSGVANTKDKWTKENIETCAESLNIIGDHAKSLGNIKLAIEPINRYENSFLQRCEQGIELLNKVGNSNVKLMLDFFHTNIEENNNGEAILLAKDFLIHCHVADSNRKSCGRGNTDWFEIMRALKTINYKGALACEPLPPTSADVYESKVGTRPEADLYAKECIEYLKFIEGVIK